ncbi:hypothetical protein HDU92_006207 [Lobulomyces angularis]|nr:hypothetical protein HDU92_006207 [Lobulomyces angularis]
MSFTEEEDNNLKLELKCRLKELNLLNNPHSPISQRVEKLTRKPSRVDQLKLELLAEKPIKKVGVAPFTPSINPQQYAKKLNQQTNFDFTCDFQNASLTPARKAALKAKRVTKFFGPDIKDDEKEVEDIKKPSIKKIISMFEDRENISNDRVGINQKNIDSLPKADNINAKCLNKFASKMKKDLVKVDNVIAMDVQENKEIVVKDHGKVGLTDIDKASTMKNELQPNEVNDNVITNSCNEATATLGKRRREEDNINEGASNVATIKPKFSHGKSKCRITAFAKTEGDQKPSKRMKMQNDAEKESLSKKVRRKFQPWTVSDVLSRDKEHSNDFLIVNDLRNDVAECDKPVINEDGEMESAEQLDDTAKMKAKYPMQITPRKSLRLSEKSENANEQFLLKATHVSGISVKVAKAKSVKTTEIVKVSAKIQNNSNIAETSSIIHRDASKNEFESVRDNSLKSKDPLLHTPCTVKVEETPKKIVCFETVPKRVITPRKNKSSSTTKKTSPLPSNDPSTDSSKMTSTLEVNSKIDIAKQNSTPSNLRYVSKKLESPKITKIKEELASHGIKDQADDDIVMHDVSTDNLNFEVSDDDTCEVSDEWDNSDNEDVESENSEDETSKSTGGGWLTTIYNKLVGN